MAGRMLQLFIAVRFVHRAYYIAYSCKTTTSESVFEKVSKSITEKLCCSSLSLDGGYTDTEVGKLRNIESYQFKPKMNEIPAKITNPKEGLKSDVRAHNFSSFLRTNILRATKVLNV